MTRKELKHAIISLVLGVLTMAALQFVEGLLNIAHAWLSAIGGGATTSAVYLKMNHFV